MRAESETYRLRWTMTMEVLVEATAEDEEACYDLAVDLVKQRLEEVAVTINGVSVHGDIDGMEPSEIQSVVRAPS